MASPSPNGVVAAPGSPMTWQIQYTRMATVCPAVAQTGSRSGDGRVASCSSVMTAMTSRSRRLYWGHMS
jgi:hypothetical protein